jgi:GNAT superfamily N-acetyltransferase
VPSVPATGRLVVRRPRRADLGALVAMMRASHETERGFSPDLSSRRLDWRLSWKAFKADLTARTSPWWLASVAGRPVGMVGLDLRRQRHRYHDVRRRVFMHSLFVVPVWRRRRVAQMLVARALAWARRWGAQQALLEMAAGNRRARRLYEGAGFRVREVMFARSLPQPEPPPR